MVEPPRVSDLVACEVRESVAVVTLSRPAALNALNREMRQALADLLGWCAAEAEQVRAVVLRGEGRAFCAGQDLKEGDDARTPAASVDAKRQGDFQRLLEEMPQPTIAALHGYALGRGLEVALTCDLRIAAEDARLGLPELRLGMIPASGGTQRLARLVGPGRALDLLLAAEPIDAATALSWGLVTRVVPTADLETAAVALARQVARAAPLAARYARRAVLEGMSLSLTEGLRLEALLAAVLRTTEDRAEGTRAFVEKRQPVFHGR